MSDEVEGTIYQTCRLMGITIFTVSHRPQLAKYHEVRPRPGPIGQRAVSALRSLPPDPLRIRSTCLCAIILTSPVAAAVHSVHVFLAVRWC